MAQIDRRPERWLRWVPLSGVTFYVMGAHPKWWHILQGSRQEAVHAVDLYNRAAAERSLEAFVVHLNLAWLYLLHAKYERNKIDYRVKNGRRLVYVDGEPKTWGLAECLSHEFDEKNPVRANIEFFIRIRNKIEHRYEKILAEVVAGKAQALVLNYEESLLMWFGPAESLSASLRFPVFLCTFTPDAITALKKAYKTLPRNVTRFVREYDASLPGQIVDDWHYDFRILLMPQSGPKSEADAVMRFIREDEMTDEQREARDVVQTIVRTKEIEVQNKGKFKPSQVVRQVSEGLGLTFLMHHHVKAWQHFKVRPLTGSDNPKETDNRYCVYDDLHEDYGYTEAWVRFLVRELRDPVVYKRVTGQQSPDTQGQL